MHFKRKLRKKDKEAEGFNIKAHLLVVSLVVSCVAGICLGLYLKKSQQDQDLEDAGVLLKIPADIMLRLLRMLVVPIMVCSILNGVISVVARFTGKILFAAVLFHGMTAFLALLVSVGAMNMAKAVEGIDDHSDEFDEVTSHYSGGWVLALTDLISQLLPTNLVEACFYTVSAKELPFRRTDGIDENTHTKSEVHTKPLLFRRRCANLLGLAVASMLAGYVINRMGDNARTVKKFIVALNGALEIFIKVVAWYTPVGMMFMIAGWLLDFNVDTTVSLVNNFVLIVVGVLLFHSLGSLCAIYFVITRKNPLKFMSAVSKALITAWATDSSAMALPRSMKCLVEEAKLNPDMVHLMMPLSAVINFDGTMLYEVAVCFMMVLSYGFILRGVDVAIICLTASVTTAASNTITQSGMLNAMWILHTMELPQDEVVLLLSVDWLMNRLRTVTNVWGDCVGTAVLHQYFRMRSAKVVSSPVLPKKSALSLHEMDEDTYSRRASRLSTASDDSTDSYDEDS